MAPATTSITGNALQQRIITLDRSNNPFSAQILEASHLVSIDLDKVFAHSVPGGASEQARSVYGPREEWVLRWLLKRFNVDQVQADSPCLEARAWLLLRILVTSVPTTVAARLLNAHKFKVTLENTLQWLHQDVRPGQDGAVGSDSQESEHESILADSSSTTIDVPSDTTRRTSRKRKRDGNAVLPSNLPCRPKVNAAKLLLCICSATRQILKLTVDAVGGDEFATEHMKATLKTTPERAGKILGSSLSVIRQVLQNLGNEPGGANYVDIHECLLLPMIGLWECRATASDDLTTESSNRIFSIECTVPTLHLLLSLEEKSGAGLDLELATRALQKLLVRHIIFPARAAFIREKKDKSPAEKHSDPLLDELLRPLRHAASQELSQLTHMDEPGPVANSVALLFRIASASWPRDSSKQRLAENPWLQNLFIHLAQCVSLLVSDALSPEPNKATVDVLKAMLQHAFNSKIQLGSSTLELIITQMSGLNPIQQPNEVDWVLVSLCLKMEPNFIISSSTKSNNETTRQPSTILEQLLRRISAIGFRILSHGSEKCSMLLSRVILPLVDAFAHARDLLGFMAIWTQQLILTQGSKSFISAEGVDPNSAESVWEDDKLLHAVAGILESSLVSAQIDKALKKACVSLSSYHMEMDYAKFQSSMVTIDCIIDGIRSDGAIYTFSGLAQSTYHLICKLFLENAELPLQHEWRLWRLLTTLITRWPTLHASMNMTEIQRVINTRALDLIRRATSPLLNGQLDEVVYVQGSYAFAFVLALAASPQNGASGVSYDGMLQPAVKTVVKSSERHSSQAPEHAIPDYSRVDLGWDGKRETLNSLSEFLLCCASQLIQSPKSLRSLDAQLMGEFIHQLYWSACLETFRNGASYGDIAVEECPKTIQYRWLWEHLLRCGVLGEDKSIAKALHKVQLANLIAIAKEDPSMSLSNDHLIFSIAGFLHIPLRAFQREERSQIANITLSKLTDLERPLLQDPDGIALALLIRCMETPSKSMDLTLNPQSLWLLSQRFDEYETVGKFARSHDLRRLMETVLRRVITACTHDQSVNYLIAFFETLSERIVLAGKFNSAYASAILIETSTTLLWAHRDAISGILERVKPSLSDLRAKYFQLLLDVSSTVTFDESKAIELGFLMRSLLSYSELLKSLPATAQVWENMFALMDSASTVIQRSNPTSLDITRVHRLEDVITLAHRILNLQFVQERPATKQFLSGAALLDDINTTQARSNLLRYLKDLFLDLSPEEQMQTFSQFVKGGQRDTSDENSLFVLERLLALQELTTGQSSAVKVEMSRIFTALCDRLPQSTTAPSCVLKMRCMDTILRKMPWVTTQWHIDNVLAAIVILASSSAPRIGTEHAVQVFMSMCLLFGTLLSVHRTKLGGRYHLVVPALQGLLRCLFEPYGVDADASNVLTLPPWLIGHKSGLNKSHAAAYARILTTICEPSVSAVARSKSRSRQELNDETKKARSIAGQHLPYLIMEFCRCQLRGRMAPEAKAALSPGLYCIFDVMPQDTMRTLNSALDSASRSVFKVLYDDYRRFGRWEGVRL